MKKTIEELGWQLSCRNAALSSKSEHFEFKTIKKNKKKKDDDEDDVASWCEVER